MFSPAPPRSALPRRSPAVQALLLSLAVALPATGARAGQQEGSPALTPGVEVERLEGLVRALCTSETAGRETGSEGLRVAAEVVAGRCAELGLEPAGSDGFFQPVPMTRWSVVAEEGASAPAPPRLILTDLEGTEHTFTNGLEFQLVLGPTGAPPSGSFEIVTVNAPEDLPETADKGVALVFTRGVTPDKRDALLRSKGQTFADWGLVLVLRSSRAGREAVVPEPFLVLDLGAEDPGDGIYVRAEAKALLVQREAKAVRIEAAWRAEEVSCQNVVALVRGVGTEEHPELAEEAVVVTANLDHRGQGSREEFSGADRTFDGADNNASGVAAVLELAEALQAEPPARSVLLLFATANERGKIGVQQQLREPSWPLERTVLALDVWALGSPDPETPGPASVWLTDFTATTVGTGLQSADLPVQQDRRARWQFSSRSSSAAYRSRGILGHRISSFGGHKRLNSPLDEPDTLDFAHLGRVTETVIGVVRALASGEVQLERN